MKATKILSQRRKKPYKKQLYELDLFRLTKGKKHFEMSISFGHLLEKTQCVEYKKKKK